MSSALARFLAAGLSLNLVAAACSSASRASRGAAAQPDAGTASGLSPAAQAGADSGRPGYTAADVHFMSGMIVHHGQAVLIAGWAPTHGASQAVRILCERIVVAQRDEIAVMQRWLRERQLPVPDADTSVGGTMPGMDRPMLMPGMLTPPQLARLDAARGPEFDRLLLTYMIQHHRGAITMVDQILSEPGAAQDGMVFRFASDVNADQTTEIARMRWMLAALPSEGRSQ